MGNVPKRGDKLFLPTNLSKLLQNRRLLSVLMKTGRKIQSARAQNHIKFWKTTQTYSWNLSRQILHGPGSSYCDNQLNSLIFQWRFGFFTESTIQILSYWDLPLLSVFFSPRFFIFVIKLVYGKRKIDSPQVPITVTNTIPCKGMTSPITNWMNKSMDEMLWMTIHNYAKQTETHKTKYTLKNSLNAIL